MRPLLGWGLAAALAGCMILPPEVEDPPPPPPAPIPVPVPLPFDREVPTPFKGLGRDVTVAQVWFVRVDRTTPALADAYVGAIERERLLLEMLGFKLGRVKVFALQDGQLVWRSEQAKDEARAESLQEALRSASEASELIVEASCSASPIREVGSSLYDSDGSVEADSWTDPHDALFVGVLDHAPRSLAFQYGCRESARALYLHDPIKWTRLAPGPTPRVRTFFMLSATRLGEEAAELRKRCRAVPGFPQSAVDGIAPPRADFYPAWRDDAAQVSQPGELYDLCESVGESTPSVSAVIGWAEAIAATYPPAGPAKEP